MKKKRTDDGEISKKGNFCTLDPKELELQRLPKYPDYFHPIVRT